MQGLKEFEWNQTVTPEQKFVSRVRKLAAVQKNKERRQYQKEQQVKRDEYLAQKAERDALKLQKKQERDQRAEERAAKKAAFEALKKEKETEQEAEPDSQEKEEAPAD